MHDEKETLSTLCLLFQEEEAEREERILAHHLLNQDRGVSPEC